MKTNGPLFAMFPKSATRSASRHAPLQLARREPPDRPTRRGCSRISSRSSTTTRTRIRAPARRGRSLRRCRFPSRSASRSSSRRPTTSASPGRTRAPLSLHFRFTARDLKGGVNSRRHDAAPRADHGPVPRHVAEHRGDVRGGSTQTVTWDVAGTDVAADLDHRRQDHACRSTAATRTRTCSPRSTPNDGSEAVTLPNDGTTHARIKVEARRQRLLRHLQLRLHDPRDADRHE